MGSDLRFNYSVLGVTVNLASRLEGQTKSYGVPIIVGSKTALTVKDKYAILELDFITVKGKTEPEVVYTILGRDDVVQSDRFQKIRELTINMLARYRSRDWGGAMEIVQLGRVSADGFGLAEFFALYDDRIRSFRDNPPPPDWNGVFALHSK
jgi:adenylate cyclase